MREVGVGTGGGRREGRRGSAGRGGSADPGVGCRVWFRGRREIRGGRERGGEWWTELRPTEGFAGEQKDRGAAVYGSGADECRERGNDGEQEAAAGVSLGRPPRNPQQLGGAHQSLSRPRRDFIALGHASRPCGRGPATS